MIKTFLTYAVLLVIGHSEICGEPAKRPELRLKVLPEKEIYHVSDSAAVTIELTNLTDQTLCFPKPAQDCEVTGTGSLIVTSSPVDSGEREFFICHMDSRGPSREELLEDIDRRWIKVAPNAIYIAKSATTQFKTAGQWQIDVKYNPPVGAFNPNYTKFLQSGANKFGCRVPKTTVAASAVAMVIPASDEK